jgi:hypothetical protein
VTNTIYNLKIRAVSPKITVLACLSSWKLVSQIRVSETQEICINNATHGAKRNCFPSERTNTFEIVIFLLYF